jgi:hypothetical protein
MLHAEQGGRASESYGDEWFGSRTADYLFSLCCDEQGHFARDCRRPPRRREGNDPPFAVGKRVKTDGEQPPDRRLYSIGCTYSERCDYVVLGLDVRGGARCIFWWTAGQTLAWLKARNC